MPAPLLKQEDGTSNILLEDGTSNLLLEAAFVDVSDTLTPTEGFFKQANKALAETVALTENFFKKWLKLYSETVVLTENLETLVISGGSANRYPPISVMYRRQHMLTSGPGTPFA